MQVIGAKWHGDDTDSAQNAKARQAITTEVNNYLRLKKKVLSDEDIGTLEARIRNVLLGGGPTRTTKVLYKKAVADADEWGRLYKFKDGLDEQKEKEKHRREAQDRAAIYECLGQQVQQQEAAQKSDAAAQAVLAMRSNEDVRRWQQQEAAKTASRKEAMLKVKAAVEEQLAEREATKKLESALRKQEEHVQLMAMAAELKAEMEAEVVAAKKAQSQLRELLAANEVHKAEKAKLHEREQELDRKYAREYAEKLDWEDKARQEALAKRAEYQTKQAAVAQSMPESKRWIDPALIERNYRARELAEERQEVERKAAAVAARNVLRQGLAGQLAERLAHQQHQKAELAAEKAALKEVAQREAEAERREKTILMTKREALRQQLESQLEAAVERRLAAEPAMTQTEREINADLLRRMHAAEAESAAE